MKTTLTIEESARLIELGVDAKLASKWEIIDTTDENDPNSFLDYEEYPIFGLEDIIAILPTSIIAPTIFDDEDVCPIEMRWDIHLLRWVTYYDNVGVPVNPDKPQDTIGSAPELIDALNSLLIWCLTEKKINLNTEKK